MRGVLGILIALAASCSSSPGTKSAAPGSTCQNPSPLSGFEVTGVASTGSLFGLVFAPLPLRAGPDDVKIVWRMTGRGDLRPSVVSPSGRPAELAWGPEPHAGSTYERPGEEWGTGYRFDEPGCWRVSFARDDNTADVWFQVAP